MTETVAIVFSRWNLFKVLLTSSLLLFGSLVPGLRHILRWWVSRHHRRNATSRAQSPSGDAHGDVMTPTTVAFFHPYCNAGGGGERVLWVAIKALQEKHPDLHCVVFTGDCDSSGPAIMAKALTSFQISLPRPPEFIFLKQRLWVEASTYPAFTLLGQSLGSVFLGWEALKHFRPHLFIDSMGYAFTLPLFANLAQCKVASYVHYPTISTDMLERVRSRKSAFNNAGFVANNSALSRGKLFYYHRFANLYRIVGAFSQKVMVNSSWTKGHVDHLWHCSSTVVYPPCNTSEFQKLPIAREGPTENSKYGSHNRIEKILSIGQFRPEKDHSLQIAAFAKLLKLLPEERRKYVKLTLVGGCRHAEDVQRVEHLQSLCEDFQVSDQIDFCLNISFSDLKSHLAEATVGLHTMYNEHFGIGVVEMMAGGAIVVAHASGGPKLDIVVPFEDQVTGFLAHDADDYALAMQRVLGMRLEERIEIRERARASVKERFSDQRFSESFLEVVDDLLPKS